MTIRTFVSSFSFLCLVLGCASGGRGSVDPRNRDASSSPDTGTPTSDGGGDDTGFTPPDAETLPDTGVEGDSGGADATAPGDAGGTDAGPSCPGGCDDGVACTVDVCAPGGCTHTPDDSLCVSPQTCNATLGCRDTMCAETPCRLVGPQCGCPSGQGCYLTTMDTRVCAPAGSSTEGETCSPDLCAAGLLCVNVSSTATEVPLCKRFCATDADCTGGPGSRCVATVGETDTSICSTNCDVVTQTGCPSDASCAIYSTMSGARVTDCSGPVGSGGQEASCTDDTSCQRGFACVNTGSAAIPDNRCLRWCRRSAPTSSCPAGTICVSLGDPPGLVFNGVEYGVCF